MTTQTRRLGMLWIGWIVIAALTGCGARVVTPDAGDAGAVSDGSSSADATAPR